MDKEGRLWKGKRERLELFGEEDLKGEKVSCVSSTQDHSIFSTEEGAVFTRAKRENNGESGVIQKNFLILFASADVH